MSAARDRLLTVTLAQRPRLYHPYLHLLGTTGIGLATLALACHEIHGLRPAELLVVPALFVLSNLVEWFAHKLLLHRRTWPVHVLFDRHTPEHHVLYQYDSMAIRSVGEFRLVLIPAAGVLTVVGGAVPIAYALGHLFTTNCGWLSLASSAVYMTSYELSHLSYHLPETSFIGRLTLVRALREHHRRHHHPSLMKRWNFNVTVPLFDWIFGTAVPEDVLEKTLSVPERR